MHLMNDCWLLNLMIERIISAVCLGSIKSWILGNKLSADVFWANREKKYEYFFGTLILLEWLLNRNRKEDLYASKIEKEVHATWLKFGWNSQTTSEEVFIGTATINEFFSIESLETSPAAGYGRPDRQSSCWKNFHYFLKSETLVRNENMFMKKVLKGRLWHKEVTHTTGNSNDLLNPPHQLQECAMVEITLFLIGTYHKHYVWVYEKGNYHAL